MVESRQDTHREPFERADPSVQTMGRESERPRANSAASGSDTGWRSHGSGRCSRRAALAGLAGGAVVGLAGCLDAAPGAEEHGCIDGLDGGCASYPEDVNLFQTNLERQACYPEETVPERVQVEWSVPTNFVHHTAAKSTPIPTHDGNVVVAGDSGTVQVRTPEGRLEWSVETGATELGFHGSPTVVGDVAFLGGYDGALYAFDVTSGARRWKTPARELGTTLAVGSSPAFHDGRLYFIVEYGGPSSGALWAVDPTDGEPELVDDRIWGQSHPSPTIDRETGHIVAGSNDGVVYAWEYPDLEFAWEYQAGGPDGPQGRPKANGQFRTGAEIKGTVAAYEGKGYVGSWDERCHCIDLETGEGLWTFDTGRSNMSNPAVDPDAGVVYTGSDTGGVWALDPESGDVLWTRNVGGRVIGALTVTAETVLVGSYDSHLYAFDKTTGQRRWRVENRGRVTSGAVPADGRIYYAERATFANDRGKDPEFTGPGHAYCLGPA